MFDCDLSVINIWFVLCSTLLFGSTSNINRLICFYSKLWTSYPTPSLPLPVSLYLFSMATVCLQWTRMRWCTPVCILNLLVRSYSRIRHCLHTARSNLLYHVYLHKFLYTFTFNPLHLLHSYETHLHCPVSRLQTKIKLNLNPNLNPRQIVTFAVSVRLRLWNTSEFNVFFCGFSRLFLYPECARVTTLCSELLFSLHSYWRQCFWYSLSDYVINVSNYISERSLKTKKCCK